LGTWAIGGGDLKFARGDGRRRQRRQHGQPFEPKYQQISADFTPETPSAKP
jgi:hypothetical protein